MTELGLQIYPGLGPTFRCPSSKAMVAIDIVASKGFSTLEARTIASPSDHLWISLDFALETEEKPTNHTGGKLRLDKNGLQEALRSSRFCSRAFESLQDIATEIESLIQTHTYTFTYRGSAPFWNFRLGRQRQELRRAWRNYRRTPSANSLERYYGLSKRFRDSLSEARIS